VIDRVATGEAVRHMSTPRHYHRCRDDRSPDPTIVYQIHGRGLSANYLGNNLLTASNIEASRATRLFDLWLQQQLFDGLSSPYGPDRSHRTRCIQ